MRQLNNEQTSPFPLPTFRIWLCGPFQVERCVGNAYQTVRTAEWGGTNLPRLLLKALFCRPGRRARRETLLEMLWPEIENEQALQNLNTAVSKLRNVLRLSRESDCLLITEDNTTTYRLPDQSIIWVDAEAALLSLQDAERTESETLTLLEDAERHFRRGGFLEGEEGLWVSGRRATIERACYRCCLRLADIYEQRGQLEQAEAQLSLLLEDDPTDEDALRRLMLLLHRQGMTHQAVRLYEQTCQQTIQEGGEVSAVTKKLAQHMRQRETGQPFLHDQPLGNSAGSVSYVHAQHLQETIYVPSYRMNLFSQSGTGEQQLGMWLLQYADYICREQYPLDAMTEAIRIILPVVEVIQMITRRQFLFGSPALLGSFPVLTEKLVSKEESMRLHYEISKSICVAWQLFHSVSSTQTLAVGQALLALTQQMHTFLPSSGRGYLYGGAYGLIGIALHFQERHEEALQARQSSYIANLSIGIPHYVISCLISLADTYNALGNYQQAICHLTEAYNIVKKPYDETSIRLLAHLLTCWADNALMLQDYRVAQKKLEEAEIYLDSLLPNEDFDKAAWLLLVGKYGLVTKNYSTALSSFEKALDELPERWILRHVMTAIGQAKAYARMRERDSTLAVAERLIPMLKTVDAQMTTRWFSEYLYGDLQEAFPKDEVVKRFIGNAPPLLPGHFDIINQ